MALVQWCSGFIFVFLLIVKHEANHGKLVVSGSIEIRGATAPYQKRAVID